jgi:putative tributyrin esterase
MRFRSNHLVRWNYRWLCCDSANRIIAANERIMCFRSPVLIALAGMLAAAAPPSRSQQSGTVPPAVTDTVEQRIFYSTSLQREMPYEVILPVGYRTGQQHYSVLYLLHGWHGDETDWVKLTHLTEVAARYQLIIVTPRGGNSWYVNSATNPTDRYADYVLDDVIEDVDSHYRATADPQHRAIAGLSMGGYGALLFTLRRPTLFGFAASISGAFSGPSGIDEVMPQLKPSIDQAYGSSGSATRKENDLDSLIAAADPRTIPYLFIECGTADPLLPSNRHLVAELSEYKLQYEYHELPGNHTWSFWDNSLSPMLAELARQLHLPPTAFAAHASSSH